MSKYSKFLTAAAVAATLGIAAAAQAATVTYTLVLDLQNGTTANVPGQWTLFADDSTGDNFGIASMQVGLNNTLSIINDMPRLTYTDSNGINDNVDGGFTLLRSASNTNSSPTGSMATVTGSFVLVLGFGQTGGTMPLPGSLGSGTDWDGTTGPTQITYQAHLKIAHGTYTVGGPVPAIDPDITKTAANVLTQVPPFTNPIPVTAVATGAALVVIGGAQPPEPASLGILAIGGIALLARRRKA